jgi:hypothetical protein
MDKLDAIIAEIPESSLRRPISESDIPESLRHLKVVAELLGVTDDDEREVLFDALSVSAKRELKTLISAVYFELSAWLGGPEADRAKYSNAYLAFSAMLMSVEMIPRQD